MCLGRVGVEQCLQFSNMDALPREARIVNLNGSIFAGNAVPCNHFGILAGTSVIRPRREIDPGMATGAISVDM